MGASKGRFGRSSLLFLITYSCFVPILAEEPLRIISIPQDPNPIELVYRFDHITPEDGLPHLSLFDMTQDSKGFLWFATEGGLTRYDGYTFKTFKHEVGDPHSPSSDIVFDQVESTYKDTVYIWSCTLNGLSRLNLFTERTVNYFHDPDDSTSLAGFPYNFAQGDSHSLWIGTNHGLDRYDYSMDTFEHFLQGRSIGALHQDESGDIWAGSKGHGLLRLQPETGEVTQYVHDPQDEATISSNTIVEAIFDSEYLGNDYLWVGTNDGGVSLLEKQSGRFQRFPASPNNPGANVETCFESTRFGASELWSQTSHYGITVMDLRTGQSSYQESRPDFPDGLSSDYILEMYEDHSGVIWVATGFGLERLNRFEQVFQHISPQNAAPDPLPSGGILSIYLDSKNRLWLGGMAGISILDPVTRELQGFSEHPICPETLRDDLVPDIHEDSRGNIWFLGRTGLYRLDPEWQHITHFPTSWDEQVEYCLGIPMQAATDVDGNMWIASSGGFTQYFPGTGTFKRYPYRTNFNTILVPRFSNTNFVLLGFRFSGIAAWDRETGEAIRIRADDSNPTSLSRGRITHMYEGRDSLLWVGSTSGLDVASLSDGIHEDLVFKHYDVEDGLPDRCISSIQEDSRGRPWVSTENGLARFDRATGRFRTYDRKDGLANSTFLMKAAALDSQGHLYFGSKEELVFFHPDSLGDNPIVPNIVLTDLQIFHKPVSIITDQDEVHRDVVSIPRSITYLDTLELSYQENVLTLEFAALDFRNSMKNQYAYKLKGFEDDWIYRDASNRQVTYTNLDPGEYVFQVKGSNNDGLWDEEGRSLVIFITPPWWQTRLAYAGYIVLGLCILIVLWLLQLKRLRTRHQVEMDHLRAERYQELDELKSRFFANISHEFRTPLTLILGPIEKLRQRIAEKELKQDLSLMQKHASRVLDLVTQLLDLSKLEAGKMKLQVSERNVVPLLRGLVLSFASLAERRDITLSFHSDLEEIRAYVEKEALVKIINNLLSNAFKFTLDGGEVSTRIGVNESSNLGPEGELEIRIEDSGIGIPKNRLDSIFDRFSQVDSSETRHHEGTGIGLALTKELVEMHKGTIGVRSREGEGSVFSIQLPLGTAHLSPDEIVELTQDEDNIPPPDIPEEEVADVEGPSRGTAKPMILIVEDNSDVRLYIRSYLDRDYRCLEALDGVDGLEQARKQIPDLIISDIMMPNMDGNELCKELKTDECTSHIPVILLTAKADMNSKLEGLETGADDYLTKPFEAAEFQVRVRNLIEQRQKLRETFQKELSIVPSEMDLSSVDQQLLEQVMQLVLANLDDQEFKVTALSEQVHMSRQHLNRKLQALTGLSASEFIRSIRLKQAALRLRTGTSSISEIAYQVGFSSPNHLATAFRAEFGQTPKQYKISFQNQD